MIVEGWLSVSSWLTRIMAIYARWLDCCYIATDEVVMISVHH